MTEVVNHINSRTQINLTLTWLHLCPPMPDQLSKPVHIAIWQISLIMCQKSASHGIHAAAEGNKSLNFNLSSTWSTTTCELLYYICSPPKEGVEHQNKVSWILRSLANSRSSKTFGMYVFENYPFVTSLQRGSWRLYVRKQLQIVFCGAGWGCTCKAQFTKQCMLW